MNKSSIFQHIGTTAVALLSLLTITVSLAATFQPGDEIKLTQDAPLYFREQEFRQGKSGDILSVLAHRADTKKVFVRGEDKDGKQIALSISEDAVILIPKSTAKLQAEAVAAAQNYQFPDALRLIAEAIRIDRQNPLLLQTMTAIGAAQTASEQLQRAKADEQRVATEVIRKRKNAAVADHPNPLNPGDSSNQQRAQGMRAEADQMAEAAKTAVATAQKACENARVALTPPSGAKSAQLDAVEPPNAEPFVEPPNLHDKGDPKYAETVEFINGKLKRFGMTIGYGAKTERMILRISPRSSRPTTFTFNPADLNPEVAYSANRVVLQVVGGDQKITAEVRTSGAPRVEHLRSLPFENLDNLEAEKLAKAFGHLILMFGGKKEAF